MEGAVRGDEQRQAGFIVMTSLEHVVPADHPLRAIRVMLDAALEEPVFHMTSFTKNRTRLLTTEVADALFTAIRSQAEAHQLLSREHFSIDGTLIEAAAALKSLRPIDGDEGEEPPADGGHNPDVDFHGERRGNLSHRSTTGP